MSENYIAVSNQTLSEISSNEILYESDSDNESIEEVHRMFFNLIQMCNVLSVKDLLDNYEFDINCKNYQGKTGLNLAIEVNCEPMVDFLLSQHNLDIGDSLMHAIHGNHYTIVIKILDILQSENRYNAQQGYEHSLVFPQYLTPLMLAAQCGHYKIISLLLKRGHKILMPHMPQCFCKEVCKSLAKINNGIGTAELKLSVFRALTNPAYITQTSDDPILTAFNLSKLLQAHRNVDRIFKSDYELLDFQVRMFAVNLIGLCRSSNEIELILTRKEGYSFFGSFPYQRLMMAMDLKQKEFVAHAYVQQILEMEWIGKWYQWSRYGSVKKCCTVFLRIVQLPWIVFLHLFLPFSKNNQYYSTPVNRMLNYIVSYIIFLIIITFENISKNPWSKENQLSCTLKTIILFYVTAFAFSIMKQIFVQGPKRYFRMLWSIYDCIKLIIFVIVLTYWYLCFNYNIQNNYTSLERKYWKSSHPVLVAEGLLSVATVMSYSRLLFLCQLNYGLGPMQITLGKITTDFFQFAIQLGLIMLAFSAGLCNFYQYYNGMVNVDPKTGYKVVQEESFVSIQSTLITLFWGIFCMTSTNAGSVVIETIPDVNNGENHYFTEVVGTVLYMAFEIFSVIVLLNMMIAFMTNTFQRITNNSYIEWVFGRTKVFLSFFILTELPPPLNLLPTWQYIKHFLMYVCNCCKYCFKGVASCISSNEHELKSHYKKDFSILINELSKRYFRDKLPSTGYVRKCNPTFG